MATIQQLSCFMSVYRTGSLTATASELGYTQPAISEQIRQLEKSLGIDLFSRVGRGVIPTDAAEVLRPHAEAALAAITAGEDAVNANKSLETGTIRFGMLRDGHYWGGTDLVASVLDKHPGMRVELSGHHSVQVFEELRLGRIDAAIVSAPVQVEGLDVQMVARDELVFITADEELKGTAITASKLSSAPLIMPDTSFRRSDTNWATVFDLFAETQTQFRSRVEVEDIEMAIELVGRGYGSTIASRNVAEILIPRLAPNATWCSFRPKKFQTFSIVTRRNASLSPAAQMMIKLLVEKFEEVTNH